MPRPIPAPPAALVAAPPAAVQAPPPPPPPPSGDVFGIMPSRATGLVQPYVAERKRTVDARHEDPAWLCVQILEDTANPRWRCLGCGMNRSGGATKVIDHLLGLNRSLICNYSIGDEAFKSNLEKVKKSQGNKEQKKAQKVAVAAVNKAATDSSIDRVVVQHHQSPIAVSLSHCQADNCDAAIAEFFSRATSPLPWLITRNSRRWWRR